MLYDQQEIEEAEETLSTLKNPGRVEILTLVTNQVLKMQMTSRYADNPVAAEALSKLSTFVKCIMDRELIVMGELVESSYEYLLPLDHLKTMDEVEREYDRTHRPGEPESEKAETE